MNDIWLDFAIRIQSIAQAGLQYGKDKYDRQRYEELRQIAAEMISAKTDIPVGKVRDLFCNESGYQTPKVDTRAAVFVDGKILLVHENNGTWSLPVGQSIVSNDEQITTEAGDIVLYAGDRIVIFYGSNSWAYTKLGHIAQAQEEMEKLLGQEDVEIQLGWEE